MVVDVKQETRINHLVCLVGLKKKQKSILLTRLPDVDDSSTQLLLTKVSV